MGGRLEYNVPERVKFERDIERKGLREKVRVIKKTDYDRKSLLRLIKIFQFYLMSIGCRD